MTHTRSRACARVQGHELNARYLKEILGHTPLQVFFGMITGVVSAFACKMVVGI